MKRALLAATALATAACGDTTLFDPMERQPKSRAFSANPFFEDGRSMQKPPQGSVPRERIVGQPALAAGRVGGKDVEEFPLPVTKELVGDRPAGSTPENSPIVKNGLAVATVLGFNANLGEGSTDSNTPMSLKVPAITVGGGGRGRDAHALTESFDTTDAWQGTQYAILLAVALAQK